MKKKGRKERREEEGNEGKEKGKEKRESIIFFSGFLTLIIVQTPQYDLGKLLIEFYGKCFPAGLMCIIGSILNLLLHFGVEALAKEDSWQLFISFLTASQLG